MRHKNTKKSFKTIDTRGFNEYNNFKITSGGYYKWIVLQNFSIQIMKLAI